jgi:hypothetical protein
MSNGKSPHMAGPQRAGDPGTAPPPGSWFVHLFAPNGTRDKDRPIHAKGHVLFWLFAAATLTVAWGLSFAPELVEKAYTEGVGQLIGRFLATVSGVFPFGLTEVLLAALIIWIPYAFLRAVYDVLNLRRRVLNALACGLFQLVSAAAGAAFYFYLAWGLNYARPDLVERMHWEQAARVDRSRTNVEELTKLCAELVEATNGAYVEASGSQDVGDPSLPPPLEQVDEGLDAAYQRVGAHLGLHSTFALSRGRAKPMFASLVLCYTGCEGFYNPFTGEANYNRLSPGSSLPQAIAHEKAHQRGVTGEDEANFFGYLACMCAADPYSRYSGYLFAQEQLLAELLRPDRDRARELMAKRNPGVQRDVAAAAAFWRQYEGVAAQVAMRANDAYLKLHHVEGGIGSYQRCAQLLVVFARVNGETCMPPGWAKASAPEDTGPSFSPEAEKSAVEGVRDAAPAETGEPAPSDSESPSAEETIELPTL